MASNIFEEYKTTAEIPVPEKLVDQVIGQENSVELIRKAASQKRNVLLVGLPGTGKSMLAQAMAELMPAEQLDDIVVYENNVDPQNPIIKTVKAGEGKKIVEQAQLEAQKEEGNLRMISMIFPLGWFLLSYVIWSLKMISDIVYTGTLLLGGFLIVGFALSSQLRTRNKVSVPKVLVDNSDKKVVPFAEGTGARAGALLGDVRHDPLQSSIDEDSLVVCLNGVWKKISYGKLWNRISKKHPDLVEKHEKGYEAIVLPKNEKVYALGMKEGKVVKSRIYSLNRRPYEGEVVELSIGEKKITLTPEHKVITTKGKKMAEKISEKDLLFNVSSSKTIC